VLQCVAVCCSVLQCVADTKAIHQWCLIWNTVMSTWLCVAVCHSVLQCVAVCCSVLQIRRPCTSDVSYDIPLWAPGCVLQCVAVCCSVLQCVAVCCRYEDHIPGLYKWRLKGKTVSWSVLECVGVCWSVLRVLQCVAVCCIVLQCVAVCCSVLQCVAVCCRYEGHVPVTSHMIYRYRVATISRLLKIIGLFCRISSLWYVSFAKET